MNNSAINIDPEIMSGAPVFRGTRVKIQTLFDYIENGKTIEDFIEDYDWVKREQAVSVIELAKNFLSNEKYLNILDENTAG
ncbi:MAG: DUF433 domain-containing protein [Ignavibacteria bacterium]|nr:DUF433 domain-containing protein [Ignavibacteriota bacterium]